MTKVKASPGTPNAALRHPKNGSVHKKKNKKFKDTSAVKAALKNGAEVTKETAILQKNGNGVGKSKKSRKSNGSNSGSPRGSAKSPPTKKVKEEEEEEDDDDSGDDINEGISVNEVLSAQEDEVDDDDSSDDGAVPDIFGNSLAEETDDDDNEFDAVEDEKKAVNKGIKMFQGLEKVKKGKKVEEEEEEDDDDEEDSSDDDEDDEDDDGETPTLGLADLLGESIKDESDDAEFEAEDDSDDDDDKESDQEMDQTLNTSNVTSTDDDEEEDDDEDDDDDDDDSSPDLTTLLGNSLVDDSDDESFEGTEDDDDEDEDMSDDSEDELPESSKVTKKQKVKAETGDDEEEEEEEGNGEANESHDSMELTTDKNTEEVRKMTAEEKAEVDSRTIFVGNIPKDTKTGRLKSEFKQFGPIEKLRIRGIIPENPKTPLKVAAITKKYHSKSTVVCAFITFKDKESVEKALSMNGKKFEGNYLRVDHSCKPKTISDKTKSVFLGNLPFTVDDNDIWEAFKDCGKIESVRIVRDRKTGLGRGFGYINFKTSDGATLAMDLNGTTVKNRELRVQVFTPNDTKKTKGKKRGRSDNNENDSPKKFRTNDDAKSATPGSAEKRKPKRSQGEKQRVKSESASPEGKFQGQTADGKKKQKKDKSFKKKQQMAAKLLAKPKKPSAN